MPDPSAHDFEVRRQLVQMQMLYEVGLALSESLDPAYVAEQVLHRAMTMVDARAGVLLRHRADATLYVASEFGLGPQAESLSTDPGIAAAWTADQLQSVDRGDGQDPRHLCLVPLRFRDEIGGLLIVADKEERGAAVVAFNDDDQGLLDSFAMQAGAALRNARLHHDLQATYEALQTAQEKIAQLEQLRALGDLAAELTHAMRHVVGLVMGHADSFLTLNSDPVQAMTAVLAAAESGQELIGRIDRVTRLGVGRERTLEQLNHLAAEALARSRQLEAADVVEWRTELAADLPCSYLNPADITEVILNLLVNAAQSIEETGVITLQTACENDTLRLSVSDTGRGITEKERQRIFDPFFTTRGGGTGTGLGLSIVLRIVEDHDGAVDVDSTPGEGTTFTLHLPLTQTPPMDADVPTDEPFESDDTEDPGPR